ncbi:hypothetical protein GOBAR_AA40169 [Gossypium barbadense]|uniref:Uncharacterized protein n=1 Tax=Gossypium barbadense TaxID=3634 RepID=A0A2P5VNZ4_GOSBA|nr:hypothetical protein GOBAR_AA40169 [Gossypium barbadense]
MSKLIEKAHNNASAYEKRSEYCDRETAKNDLNMATKLDPLRTYPYRYRAAVLMDDQKETEAVEELSKAIAFKPDLQMLHLRAAFYESMEHETEPSVHKKCERHHRHYISDKLAGCSSQLQGKRIMESFHIELLNDPHCGKERTRRELLANANGPYGIRCTLPRKKRFSLVG